MSTEPEHLHQYPNGECVVVGEPQQPSSNPLQLPNWTNPTPTEWARRAWQAWFEHGGNLLDDVILPLADKLAAAQAEAARLREAIQNALEVDRTIPRNGTDEVHSNQPQGWMPPGKRRKIIDSLSAALDKKEGQP